MGPRILIIHDSPDISTLLQEVLAEEGYDVVAWTFQQAGLPAIQRLQPRLILLDYSLGETERAGELLHALQPQAATQALAVMVTTTFPPLVEAIADVLDQYHVPVVPEPFSVPEFLASVQQVVPREPSAIPATDEPSAALGGEKKVFPDTPRPAPAEPFASSWGSPTAE